MLSFFQQQNHGATPKTSHLTAASPVDLGNVSPYPHTHIRLCTHSATDTNGPRVQMLCLHGPAQTHRPRTLDLRPWLLPGRTEHSIRSSAIPVGGAQNGLWPGRSPSPHSGLGFSPLLLLNAGVPTPWQLSLCGSRCAFGTNAPLVRMHTPCVADPPPTRVPTAAHICSQKNLEPSKAGPQEQDGCAFSVCELRFGR